MLHTLRFFFSSKCRLFLNATFFGSCVIHILYTECAKIKKKFRRQNAKKKFKVNYLLFAMLSICGKEVDDIHITLKSREREM